MKKNSEDNLIRIETPPSESTNSNNQRNEMKLKLMKPRKGRIKEWKIQVENSNETKDTLHIEENV